MKRLFEMMGGMLGGKRNHSYYIEQGTRALQEEDYLSAEKDFAKALELAEEVRAHDDVARASLNLAMLFERTDRLAVAEGHYRKAFQTEDDSEHHEEAARILVLLGKLYHKMHRMPDAEQVLQYSMSIYQQHFGAHHEGIANAARTLADCYLDSKSYAEAETLLLRAIAIDTDRKGSTDPAVASSTHKLAVALQGQKKDAEAEKSYKAASDAFETNKDQYDKPTAHNACACLHDFGRFYLQKGKQSEAQTLFKRAMELAEEYPGYLDEADLAEKTGALSS